MTTLIKHKRVEFSELFYDLVFVFRRGAKEFFYTQNIS